MNLLDNNKEIDKRSNWEVRKSKSAYHFEFGRMDPRWDSVNGLGKFSGDWKLELSAVIETATPRTWRTRQKDVSLQIEEEEYDLIKSGTGADAIIGNFEYNLPRKFRDMAEMFCLDKMAARVHVQMPGNVFTMHIDKLKKVSPESHPDDIIRIMVHLNDYEHGHFMQYGNYVHQFWKAGDFYTFDWKHVPHSTANASLTPRVILLITGVMTPEAREFLSKAKNNSVIEV